MGQNFLVDPAGLQAVLDSAALQGTETVLEIGAGAGALTRLLASRAARVVAIEIDRRLAPALEEALAGGPSVRVVWGDILQLDVGELVGPGPYIVVANIPYQLTSHLLRSLLESPSPARRVVLTLQKEVVERILAGPGDLSLLSLSVQVYGRAQAGGVLPPSAFLPVPKVESSIVRIDRYDQPRIPGERIRSFFRVARAGFSQRRKQLRNSLSAGLAVPPQLASQWIEKAGIPPKARAQELRLDDWSRILDAIEGDSVQGDGLERSG
jgi:16S rRNA (adenine1518-N6/adenine1519-N6)-dimethyltransferase